MRLATGLALMLTLLTGGARAQSAPAAERCVGPSIVLQPPLDQRRSWTRAAGATRRRVAELSDVDACTRLEIEATDDSVQVRASAADGRTVVRQVSKPSELEGTVVALLVLPPAERAEPLEGSSPAGSKAEAPPAAAPKPQTAPTPAAKAPPPPKLVTPDETNRGAYLPGSDSASGHAFELALAGAGRSTGYLFGAGVSAVADWELSGWLVGATVHAEQASGPRDVAGRFSTERNGSIGALFGRRLVRRPFFLDVAVEAPVLALHTSRWTSQSIVSTPGTGESDDVPGETDDVVSQTVSRTQTTPPQVDVRAGGFLRAVVPFAGHFGAALAVDGERSLGLVKAAAVSGQPASLAWNFGLSLGLFWSGG